MSARQQLPLGARIPESIHAVSVSMPTMGDVIRYEEKDPTITVKIASGYPRFVTHTYLRQIASFWETLFDKPGQPVWLTSSERVARQLEAYLDTPGTKYQSHGGVSGLRLPDDSELNRKAKLYLQHIGGGLSTRQAEDYLLKNELLATPQEEALFEGDATGKITSRLSELCGGAPTEDIILTNSGMNAFYAAFKAVNEMQSASGRHSWIKLGWLYVDTMHILDKLSPETSDNIDWFDVFDLDGLEALLQSRPGEFAGLITEAPTNPLIQTMDIERLRKLADAHGFCLLLDPTANSPANVDIAPYADIIVNSLTKYAANQGDVIMGAAIVSSRCPSKDTILKSLEEHVEDPYERDVRRLAQQIDGYAPLIEETNANTLKIVDYLENHSRVKKVYWAREAASAANYEQIARSADSVGSLLSFALDGDLASFYDALPLSKGPSFGMQRSLICPFIYLAHYDLVTSASGQEQLAAAGISPELLRLSIGSEPASEIIDALEEGFKAMVAAE